METSSCELCGLSFREQEQLRDHMRRHVDDFQPENKLFDCKTCRRSFLVFEDYDLHNRRIHGPDSTAPTV